MSKILEGLDNYSENLEDSKVEVYLEKLYNDSELRNQAIGEDNSLFPLPLIRQLFCYFEDDDDDDSNNWEGTYNTHINCVNETNKDEWLKDKKIFLYKSCHIKNPIPKLYIYKYAKVFMFLENK